MADQLATPADLASALQQDVDTATATLLIETATAIVQEACGGQRIIEVVGDVVTLTGTTDSWLDLPQIPVTAVTSVVLDGITLSLGTDFKVFGNRLWRRQGWQSNYGWPWDAAGQGQPWYTYAPPTLTWPINEPSGAVTTYTHGYPTGHQRLQLARSAVLSLCATAYSNPSGASSESVDDYSVSFGRALDAPLVLSPTFKAALRRQYGRRAGLVRIG
jgi:hypothetical protein